MSWKLPSEALERLEKKHPRGEFKGFGLPARLEAVAACVGIGAKVADIGTDHGLLPIALVGSGRAIQAIAADLRPKPLSMAEQNVQRFQKADKIELRLGDGLTVLEPFEADTVTIAGMSGRRMVEILRQVDLDDLEIDRLILQPNSDQLEMRQCLAEDGWAIVYERLVACGGRCYVVIVLERAEEQATLSRADALLGPYLRKEKSDALYQIWCKIMADLIQIRVRGLRQGGGDPEALALAQSELDIFSEVLD